MRTHLQALLMTALVLWGCDADLGGSVENVTDSTSTTNIQFDDDPSASSDESRASITNCSCSAVVVETTGDNIGQQVVRCPFLPVEVKGERGPITSLLTECNDARLNAGCPELCSFERL